MKIVNPGAKDYHMHTLNYSDGMNTIDELVKYAGELGLEEIAITDHSDATLDHYKNQEKSHNRPINSRGSLKKWRNIHNDTNIIFGVEGDILDEQGNSCLTIHGKEGDFLILSLHKGIYKGDLKNVTQAYINAIKKYHDKIDVLGHPCLNNTCEFLDMKKLCEVANEYKVPLEFNAKDNLYGNANLELQKQMLEYADNIYVNSDSHTLYDLKEARNFAFNYLRENNYIK